MKTFMFWLLAACCAVPAAAGQPAPFVFAVVSDVHCESYDPRTAAKYAAALRDAYKAGARAMVVVGDASDGLEEDYKVLRSDASYKFDMYNCSSVWEPYGTDNRPLEGNFSEGYIVKAGPGGVKVLGRDFVKGEFMKDASF